MSALAAFARRRLLALIAAAMFATIAPRASAEIITVEVSITNLAPVGGTFLTPFWAGLHDGQFTTMTEGSAASPFLERIAEDGSVGPIRAAFAASGHGFADGVAFGAVSQLPDGSPVGPGPIAPGATASFRLTLDTTNGAQYLAYASMVIPSNDAFFANETATEQLIFDGSKFLGTDFIIAGGDIFDAGTEVNTESAADTAFFSQTTPDTGTVEGGVVHRHPGFLSGGRILSEPNFAQANFLASGYNVARVRVRSVPEPSAMVLAGLGGGFLSVWQFRRRDSA